MFDAPRKKSNSVSEDTEEQARESNLPCWFAAACEEEDNSSCNEHDDTS